MHIAQAPYRTRRRYGTVEVKLDVTVRSRTFRVQVYSRIKQAGKPSYWAVVSEASSVNLGMATQRAMKGLPKKVEDKLLESLK